MELMTNLETFIAFTLIFLPALIFWILVIAHVANKMYDAIERDKQTLTGYDKIVDQIKNGVCEESLVDVINTLGEQKEKRDELNEFSFSITGCKDEIVNKRDEYLKRNSDYRDAKSKYVEDKLNDYLNTDEATVGFQKIFSTINVSHDFRKKVWLAYLDEKRIEFETDFDNL